MKRLAITANLAIDFKEIELTAVRAQGAGGQNVNKVSNAIHLRFNIRASTLPEACKTRLLAMHDRRLTEDGVLIIKAQESRSLEQNRTAALERLAVLIRAALTAPKRRRPTQPSLAARQQRLESKRRRGRTKSLRRVPE